MKIESIEWHKENIKNTENYKKRIEEQIKKLQNDVNKINEDNKFKEFQIAKAIKMKKNTFTENFGKKEYEKIKK